MSHEQDRVNLQMTQYQESFKTGSLDIQFKGFHWLKAIMVCGPLYYAGKRPRGCLGRFNFG